MIFYLIQYTTFNIVFAGWKSRESVPKLVEKFLEKKLMVDEFITHNFDLNGINEAFDLMHAGKS